LPLPTNKWFPPLLLLCTLIVCSLLFFIIVFLLDEAALGFTGIGASRFLGLAWNPTENQYGILPMLLATLLLTFGALLLAAPLAIAIAVYCNYYSFGRIAAIYRQALQLMAGVPSVVYGFWGLVVLVPTIARLQPPGASLLAGTIILALMILPTIALIVDSHLKSLPPHYIQNAKALGLSRWTTVRQILLPAARLGILTAMLLGVARAMGETMAVLMVCGNIVKLPSSVFDPVRALTANIALEMAYAMDAHRAALFFCGVVLLGLSMLVVNLVAQLERGRSYV